MVAVYCSKYEHASFSDRAGSTRYMNPNIMLGMYRRRGSNPPLPCDPGWVV